MKRFTSQILIVVGLVAAMAVSGFAAPASPVMTTLGAALNATATSVTLASTTGMSASSTTGVPTTTFLLLDAEVVKITAISSSTVATIVRGQDGTTQTAHASGVYAVYGFFAGGDQWQPRVTGSPTYGVFLDKGTLPQGACTWSLQQYSPFFVISSPGINGASSTSARAGDCIGGKFQYGDWPATVDVAAIRQCTIPIGGAGTIVTDLTAYGTDAVRVNGTIYVGSIDVPGPLARVVTLLSSLTGTTAPTTDKQLFALYDSAPGTTAANPIMSSAIAGVAAATADIFFDQNIALTNGAAGTARVIVPGRYFFALQLNGGTTTIQMVATADGRNSLVGNSRTGVFGTLGAITVPTTLTTSTAPIACIG